MKNLFVNNQKLSYKKLKNNTFCLSLNNILYIDSLTAYELHLNFELYKSLLIKNNAILNSISEEYSFTTENDVKNFITDIENYLLSEKLKGSSISIEYK